jgi:hypothetical protein
MVPLGLSVSNSRCRRAPNLRTGTFGPGYLTNTTYIQHAVHVGLPALAGQLGAIYAIPIIYVPVLMITHFVAFYWLVLPHPKAAPARN